MLREAWYITERELKHFVRRKIQVITSFIQPVIWLAFFGLAINTGITGFAMSALGSMGSVGSLNMPQLFV